MKSVVFNSPYQDQVDVVDFGLHFKTGEPRDVTDEQAESLLRSAFFTEASQGVQSSEGVPFARQSVAPEPDTVE